MRTPTLMISKTPIDAPANGAAIEWHENDLAVQFGSVPLDADEKTGEIDVMGVTAFTVLAMTLAVASLGSVLLG